MYSLTVKNCTATLVFLVVWAGALAPASADVRWAQLPANPIWVQVPQDWSVRADPRNPLLFLGKGQQTRLELRVHTTQNSLEGVQAHANSVEVEHPGVKWDTASAAASVRSGQVFVAGTRMDVQLRAVVVEALTLSAVLYTPPQETVSARRVVADLLSSLHSGWPRPGGVRLRVPQTRMDISLRDRGWAGVAQPDASLLHVATLDESALMRFEIESTRGQEASTFLERLARGAGGEQMSFDAIAPWQADTPARTRRAPGNRTPVVGHRVRGLLEPSSGENSTVYGLVLYGVPQPSGLLIVWGTAEGSREKVQELFSQMEDIMKSLRRRPNSP